MWWNINRNIFHHVGDFSVLYLTCCITSVWLDLKWLVYWQNMNRKLCKLFQSFSSEQNAKKKKKVTGFRFSAVRICSFSWTYIINNCISSGFGLSVCVLIWYFGCFFSPTCKLKQTLFPSVFFTSSHICFWMKTCCQWISGVGQLMMRFFSTWDPLVWFSNTN